GCLDTGAGAAPYQHDCVIGTTTTSRISRPDSAPRQPSCGGSIARQTTRDCRPDLSHHEGRSILEEKPQAAERVISQVRDNEALSFPVATSSRSPRPALRNLPMVGRCAAFPERGSQ